MTLQPGTDLNLTIADPPSEPAFEDYINDLARRNGYNHDRHVLIAPDGHRLIAVHVDALFDIDPIIVPPGEPYPQHLALIDTRQMPRGEYNVHVIQV